MPLPDAAGPLPFIVKPTPSCRHRFSQDIIFMEVAKDGVRLVDAATRFHRFTSMPKFSKNEKRMTFAYIYIAGDDGDGVDTKDATEYRFFSFEYKEIFEACQAAIEAILRQAPPAPPCEPPPPSIPPSPPERARAELLDDRRLSSTRRKRLSAPVLTPPLAELVKKQCEQEVPRAPGLRRRPRSIQVLSPTPRPESPEPSVAATAHGGREASLISHISNSQHDGRDVSHKSLFSSLHAFTTFKRTRTVDSISASMISLDSEGAVAAATVERKATTTTDLRRRSRSTLMGRGVRRRNAVDVKMAHLFTIIPPDQMSTSKSHLVEKEAAETPLVRSGTDKAILERLLDEGSASTAAGDQEAAYLFSFRAFSSAGALIKALLELWALRDDDQADKAGRTEQRAEAITRFTRRWVGTYPPDFEDPGVRDAMVELVGIMGRRELLDQLLALPVREQPAENATRATEDGGGSVKNARVVKDPIPGREYFNYDLSSHNPKEIAQQLSLVDFEIFCTIRVCDFADFLWQPEGGGSSATAEGGILGGRRHAGLSAFVRRFNQIGYWVATAVVSKSTQRDRAATLEKIIRVAEACLGLQNFNACYALICGLQMMPVHRLKRTWAGVSSKVLVAFEKLQTRFSYSQNYKTLRELERSCDAQLPKIPCFGLIMKDLTFMNDGNPSHLEDGAINFDKFLFMYSSVAKVIDCQRHVCTL
ncbi:hypothetical protein HK101_010607 [Irineochytrium annulatum]|nr:hypothetical protein HK101_010607 [Irineochytrium annulatum]